MNLLKLPDVRTVQDLKGKRVLVRASLNVPIENGVVLNYFRIMRAMPTLLHLTRAGARVILITHVGRDPKSTVEPIYKVLKEHLAVTYVPRVIGKEVEEAIGTLKSGEALLLENIRSHEAEVTNNQDFAAKLASYGELYVNDDFANSHRRHASMVGIPQFVECCFGITFQKEYEELSRALKPESPSLFILGGAKFETKLPLLEKFSHTYDQVFVGGALANDLFRAKGYEVGTSLTSGLRPESLTLHKKENVVLPADVTVKGEKETRITDPDDVQQDESILDVGPKSVKVLAELIKDAKTILWNGPLGNYEHGFVEYTKQCAQHIAESSARSVVGGGDTIAAIESLAINDKFDFLSTAGGAMLTFLDTETLPAIDAVLESEYMLSDNQEGQAHSPSDT